MCSDDVELKHVKLDSTVHTHIKKTGGEYRKRFGDMANSDDRVHKLEEHVKKFAAGKIPSGYPAYKMPYRLDYLDNCFAPESDPSAETSFQFTVRAGYSYAKVKERIHREYLSMQTALDLKVAITARDTQKANASLDKFTVECAKALKVHGNMVNEISVAVGNTQQQLM